MRTAVELSARRKRCWDVFCRVVDNYGDAAICWRLARQLVSEHGITVRLWMDNLDALHCLHPQVSFDAKAQRVEGVDIRRWSEDCAPTPREVVIEAFGCGLPDRYVAAMAQRQPSSLWITLEYLSAEAWVATHHGLPSPHPRLPLRRYFFFPGFERASGGLLREQALFDKREGFMRDPVRQQAFWTQLGFAPPPAGAQLISLFGYENAAAPKLLQTWSQGDEEIVIFAAASRLRLEIAGFFGKAALADGKSLRRGPLEARFIPFLSQERYDELLWLCDWNFVRGEDSFVRAQWARRPLVWQIYPQAEDAHWAKLNAFLDRYTAGLDEAVTASLRALWHGWNGGSAPALMPEAWRELSRHRSLLARHALDWASRLAAMDDLGANLVQFCESKVK